MTGQRKNPVLRAIMLLSIALQIVLLGACGQSQEASGPARRPVDAASVRQIADASDGMDWAAYGRTFGEQHYSPLTDVNAGNVGKLGLAWYLDLPNGNTVTQPLAVNGILYFTVGNSVIHAVDAVAGKELWVFDPKANEAAGMRMRTSWGSRGIAYWNGKIYTGTVDGRLIAVDVKTGRIVWSQQTLQPGDLRFITGAPRVFDGKVIIGHGGADSANVRGYVTTYEAETGQKLWRFFMVPGDPKAAPDGEASDPVMAKAARTWSGQWWKYGGGGTAWNSFAYDAESNTVFVGTGNGSPWNHRIRSEGKGDNLFLCSILALDARTGRYKWHYQINPAETWDYNAAMDMHLADVTVGRTSRKALITAPKNGFIYVLDRTNGKLISAEKIAPATWASHIDLATGRPVENPAARFPDGSSFELWPNGSGAHTALPSAFNPKTGLVYIPVGKAGVMIDDKGIKPGWQRSPYGTWDWGVNAGPPPKPVAPASALVAWNPSTGKPAWKVATPLFWNGGLMTTAGNLVFQGQVDGKFNAYDASDGKRLWSFPAQGAVLAPPITYMAGGRQYVTVLTGIGLSAALVPAILPAHFNYRTQERRVLTFAIDSRQRLPAPVKQEFTAIDDLDYKANPAAEGRGAQAFGRCFVCHGAEADGRGGAAPDLRTSGAITSPETFREIVRNGGLVSAGMPQFQELTDAQLEDIRQYVRKQARALKASPAR